MSLGYCYFCMLAYAAYNLAGDLNLSGDESQCANILSHAALFLAVVSLYVGVPAQLFHFDMAARVAIVAWGWERALATYSYCCEVSDAKAAPPLSDSMFFLQVSPELVFPSRGRIDSARLLMGIARVGLGAIFLVLVRLGSIGIGGHGTSHRPPIIAALGPCSILYLGHSGLAHIQIGLCKVIGFRVPERYNYAFLAASPREFWERWNIYMGSWVRIYLYAPLFRFTRKRGRRAVNIFLITTVIYLWLGAMHALHAAIVGETVAREWMMKFTAWGIVLAAANSVEEIVRKFDRPSAMSAFRALSRTVVLGGAILSFWST
jgi:hypothetical protein